MGGCRLQTEPMCAGAKVIMDCIKHDKKSKEPFHEMNLGNIKPSNCTQPPFSKIKHNQSFLSTSVAHTNKKQLVVKQNTQFRTSLY